MMLALLVVATKATTAPKARSAVSFFIVLLLLHVLVGFQVYLNPAPADAGSFQRNIVH
jgi:Ni,Fe-hydrogenase I cytochrome b subunit